MFLKMLIKQHSYLSWFCYSIDPVPTLQGVYCYVTLWPGLVDDKQHQKTGTPRKYVFWGAIQYFAGQRYTLTKLQNACKFYSVIAASLVDSEKDTKLRAHTVNLAFKLRSFVG